jgi:UDP-glucose 4-epimerase
MATFFSIFYSIEENSMKANSTNRKQKVFITGGCGFIGANLVGYLLEKGYTALKLYDNLSVGNLKNLEKVISKFGKWEVKSSKNRHKYNLPKNPEAGKKLRTIEVVIADILDKNTLIKETKGFEAFVHLAAHTRVLESIEDPEENVKINTIGTFNALEAARLNRMDRFIFASSNAAVGEKEPPIHEEMVPEPISPYGATKLYGEALCSAYYHSYDLKTISLRFANAYGPYSERKTSVVAKFIRRAKEGKPLEIYGDGEQTRDFVHAKDIAQAIFLSLTYSPKKNLTPKNQDLKLYPWGKVYQVGSGEETRIIDLAKMIQDWAVERGFKKPEIVFKEEKKGEIKRSYSVIKKINNKLSFNCRKKLINNLESLF